MAGRKNRISKIKVISQAAPSQLVYRPTHRKASGKRNIQSKMASVEDIPPPPNTFLKTCFLDILSFFCVLSFFILFFGTVCHTSEVVWEMFATDTALLVLSTIRVSTKTNRILRCFIHKYEKNISFNINNYKNNFEPVKVNANHNTLAFNLF